MAQNDDKDLQETRALSLRVQALGLLQQAQAIDGLKPYSVTHRHDYGASTYLIWAREAPSEEEAVVLCDVNYEPDKEEFLEIESNFSLEELTGSAVSSRLLDFQAGRAGDVEDEGSAGPTP